jgi:hypothetical protein
MVEPNPIALMIAKEMGFIEHKEKKGLYYLEIGKSDVAYIDFRKSNVGSRYGNIAGKMVDGDKIPILLEYQKNRDKFLEMQLTAQNFEEIKHAIRDHFLGVIPIGKKEEKEKEKALPLEEKPQNSSKSESFKTPANLEKEHREIQQELQEGIMEITRPERGEKIVEEMKVQMQEKEIAPIAAPIAMEAEIVVPRVNVETVVKHFTRFQELKRRVLQDEDYLFIGKDGKRAKKGEHVAEHIKKTGWAKLALIFNLNVEFIKREKLWGEDSNGKYYIWTYHVRAIAPNGRYQEAEGACSSRDPFFAKRYDPQTKEERWIEPDEKNIMLKAQSVAFNRAVSFLIGGGELSAEEIENEI